MVLTDREKHEIHMQWMARTDSTGTSLIEDTEAAVLAKLEQACKYGQTDCANNPMDCQCALDAVFQKPVMSNGHSCSDCDRPACIKVQRDELRRMLAAETERQALTDEQHAQMVPNDAESHWYCVNKTGIATLCIDEEHAKEVAANSFVLHPQHGPYSVVQMPAAEVSGPSTRPPG